MIKSDLRTGMFVEIKEGEKYIVLLGTYEGDRLVNIKNGCYIGFDEVNEDLTTATESKGLDIIKVYSNDCISSCIVDIIGNSSKRCWYKPQKLIWERGKSIQINVKASIENIEEIKEVIADLEERLSNIKIKLSL
jgi:hypothetical protein